MSCDGVWHSYAVGKHDVGAHGFNATLEDWAKFGLFIMNNGVLPNGRQIWSIWPKAETSMLEQTLEASLMFNPIVNKLAL
ncbi:hypothetical protein [Snodgrassella alvi]|jgi:CubicO group peptidase (beta-lactamase class C family)|uniref:hypothetical protein n=1 Tax=Snodgrassella alvi TaxID=1196083 RepID=UPI001C557923|nr:hypothetical protein [Snodgrassella alvi]